MNPKLATRSRRQLSVCVGVHFWLWFVAVGCSNPSIGRPAIESLRGPTMGTTYSLRFYLRPTAGARPPTRAENVDARLAELNAGLSTYDPESELSRFNQSASTDWFAVSEETAKVAAFALELAEDCNGAFDPTVGPVVNLWGFGPEERRLEPPTDEEIAAAKQRVGWRLVEARLDPPAIKKTRPDVYLDLSAVAKGYASDAIGQLLQRRGVRDYLVEIGGEIACRGAKPDGSGWRIGVEKPDTGGRAIQLIVELTDEALATSGDYRNFFEHEGVRYSHTIDPATGRPVTHDLATVSVRAATCMEADALATALLVMGPERGYDWAKARSVAALFIRRTDDGPIEKTTPAWDNALAGED